MDNVKVNRVELLEIVRKNRDAHSAAWLEAVDEYKAAVIKLCKENLKLAKTEDLSLIPRIKPIPPVPTAYLNEYDRAIRMLEMSVDTEIVLEQHDFQQLVLDEWSWKKAFVGLASTYKSL